MNTLHSRPRLRGAGFFVLPVVAACLVSTARAQVVFATDFSGALPPEFAAPDAQVWPTEGYANLGPVGRQFGNTFLRYSDPALVPTTLHLTGLPPHTCIDVAFLLAIIDSWDGVELFQVRVDGQLLFSHWFDCSNNTSSYAPPPGVLLGTGSLGFNSGPYYDNDRAYDLGADPAFRGIPHASSTLTIEWTVLATPGPLASNWQGGSDESWAIDAVRVTVGTATASTFGGVCGQPPLTASPALQSWPRLGTTFRTDVANAPTGTAYMAIGLSNITAAGQPLPLPLAPFGMPGCSLLIDPAVLAQPCTYVNPNVVQHQFAIPNAPSLLGVHAFLQAWAPAPGANAAGIVVSNGVAITVGT